MAYSSTVIMEAAGSGEYIPHDVTSEKTAILILNVVKTIYLVTAVIFHITFHNSYVRCLLCRFLPQMSYQLFILQVVFQMGMSVL